MKDAILTILESILIIAIPILARYLVTFLKKKADEAAVKSNNEAFSFMIKEIVDAVSTAVTYVSQTYVDALKKDGIFTKEDQEEALERALTMVMEILSREAIDFIEDVYGNITKFLTAKIEAEVRRQKTLVFAGELISD